MFITAHTSVALWIATKIVDPVTAFVFGLISHFILDIIPHGDEQMGEHITDPKAKDKYRLRVGLTDLVIATALLIFFVVKHPSLNKTIVSWAVLGAWLPDLLWIGIEKSKIKWLLIYNKIHTRIHRLIHWEYPLVYGVPFQIIFTLLILKMAY